MLGSDTLPALLRDAAERYSDRTAYVERSAEGQRTLTYADLRDWWGGERFRTMAVEAGKTETLIAAAEEKLKASPSDPAALLTLAYLLPARGDAHAADAVWQKLGVDLSKTE